MSPPPATHRWLDLDDEQEAREAAADRRFGRLLLTHAIGLLAMMALGVAGAIAHGRL